MVVAGQTESADNLFPDNLVVALVNGAEKPGAISHVAITFCVEHSVASDIRSVESGIFGVHMKNAGAQSTNSYGDLYTLPEKMAGIEIDADIFAPGFTETQSRF